MAVKPIDILTCEIRVGTPDPESPIKILNPIVIKEVESIKIVESFKELIGSAEVSFPKGTMYQSTIIQNVTMEGKKADTVTVSRTEDGVLIEKKRTLQPVTENSFIVGQRISIKIGYNGNIQSMFEGYIKKITSESAVTLECANMAYKLQQKQAPKFTTPPNKTHVNDVCGEKYGLLKGTHFELHKATKEWNIQVGQINTTDNFTVADVLQNWSKHGLYCYLKFESDDYSQMPKIAIGRPYSSRRSEMFGDDVQKMAVISDRPEVYQFAEQKNRNSARYFIDFLYNVAENRLKATRVDPNFLAVKAQGLGADEKFFTVTVRRNPDYDPSNPKSEEFQTINATQISPKRHKATGNTTATGAETNTKVDLSNYTVISYHSTKKNIKSDELVKEAIEYFKNYNLNGVEGSVVVFGDFGIRTGSQVELYDTRNTAKNGVYLVGQVTTLFGASTGYRQELELPYKIQSVETYGKQ